MYSNRSELLKPVVQTEHECRQDFDSDSNQWKFFIFINWFV